MAVLGWVRRRAMDQHGCPKRPFVERPSTVDIVRRLECSANGPTIHTDYYRQDCADAAAEIKRLRTLLYAFAAAGPLFSRTGDEG